MEHCSIILMPLRLCNHLAALAQVLADMLHLDGSTHEKFQVVQLAHVQVDEFRTLVELAADKVVDQYFRSR